MKTLLDVDDETGRQIRASGVIPVVTVTDPGCAGPRANALKTDGLAVAEVTLRTRAAVEVLSRIATDPKFAVGAGTVITPEQLTSPGKQALASSCAPASASQWCIAAVSLGFCRSLECAPRRMSSRHSTLAAGSSSSFRHIRAAVWPHCTRSTAPSPTVSFIATGRSVDRHARRSRGARERRQALCPGDKNEHETQNW